VFAVEVRGRPAPQGSKRPRPIYKGKGAERQFTGKVAQQEMSPHVHTWRDAVQTAAEKVIANTGHEPFTGPVRVRMVLTVQKPASRSKTRRTWPCSMPDLSKLCRSTEDALTFAGVWRDDALVVEYGRLAKVYPGEDPDSLPVPGARIWVEPVTDPDAPPEFGQPRAEPCARCGGAVYYRYGNWACQRCVWSTAKNCKVGRLTLEHCPECGGLIAYNGNYFCRNFGDGCEWALPHPARKRADVILARRLTGETS
jgi:Holliday junction resolvase RusA-like endonuclease